MYFNNLENISVEVLTDTFNRAFEGYEIPLRFEVPAFERKLHVEHFSPKHSVGAFNEQGELVGFIIHCDSLYNKKIVYNSGTGVLPAYRGNGITKEMYRYAKEQFLQQGITEVILEVLVNNKPAYKSYIDSGFVKSRNFKSYKGAPIEQIIRYRIEKVTITEASLEAVKDMTSIKPSWQNDFQAMLLSKDFAQMFVAYQDEMPMGYLIYNPNGKRIHQIAVAATHRRLGVGSSLLAALYQEFPDVYTIINIDANDEAIHSFFTAKGFESLVELDELVMSLDNVGF
jgi:ribosomal protein S18 acetylase RimI-like enzyme